MVYSAGMDRRTLLSLFPALATPFPAWAEDKRGIPIVGATDMLVALDAAPAFWGDPVRDESHNGITVSIVQDEAADLSCEEVLVFNCRPGNQIGFHPLPYSTAKLRRGQVSELFSEVVRVACIEARDTLKVSAHPDFKANRGYTFWDEETDRAIFCTSNGPIGYRFQKGERYGAVAVAQRITSVWEVIGGPRR